MKRFLYFFILFIIWITLCGIIAIILAYLGIYVFFATPIISFGLTLLVRPHVYLIVYNKAGLFEGFAGKPVALVLLGLGALLLIFDTAMSITSGSFLR